MKMETKRDRLLEFVRELKGNGYKVYAPGNITTYCHFMKGNKIGYVECGDYGFNFGSVHKPCRECGTGYSIHREIQNPLVSMAKDCLVLAPSWAYDQDIKAIVKYKNWEDYTNYPGNKWSSPIEI